MEFDYSKAQLEEYNRKIECYYKKLNAVKELRQKANFCGIALAILTASMQFLIMLVLRMLPEGARMGLYNFISDDATFSLIQVVVSICSFIPAFFIFSRLCGTTFSKTVPLSLPKKSANALPLTLIGFAFMAFSNLAVMISGNIFILLGFEKKWYPYTPPPFGVAGVLLSVISTAVTAALVEEFALRGVLMQVLRKYGDGFAVLVSALVFGLMHGNLTQIPFAFLAGLFFGYITVKTESLWPAVAVHFGNNLMSVAADYVFYELDGIYLAIASLLYNVIMILIGAVGLVMLKNKSFNTAMENKAEEESVLSFAKKTVVFLTAPTMWVFYGLIVYSIL